MLHWNLRSLANAGQGKTEFLIWTVVGQVSDYYLPPLELETASQRGNLDLKRIGVAAELLDACFIANVTFLVARPLLIISLNQRPTL